MGLLDHGRRWASLRTRSRVWLLELTEDYFETLLLRRPDIALVFAGGICRQFRDMESRLSLEILETQRQLDTLSKMIGESEKNVPELEGQLSVPAQTDRGSERPVVRPGAPRLYIRTLGHFRVWRDEVPIEEQEWRGCQPKLLLKAIITRPTPVSKYVLMEDLWPEAPPETGEANFKFVLYQLRRTLEPELPKGFRSSYISLKGGIVTLDRTLCQVDLDKFLSLSEQGRKAQDIGDLKSAHSFHKAASELYKGDFLSEDLYTPWVTLRRQDVQKRYINVLRRMAEFYEKEGNSKKAIECHTRIIRMDPLFEYSYQRLMLLYSQRGQRAIALKVFEDLKRYLDEEFSVLPDKLTISIYEKIVSECHAYVKNGSQIVR